MAKYFHKKEESLEDEERFGILSRVKNKMLEPRKPGDPIEWLPELFEKGDVVVEHLTKDGTWQKNH